MLSSIASYGDIFHHDTDASFSLAMIRSARRGPWLPEEDNTLLQLVRTQGANNWVRISQQIQHRSPKQCRERYHQNLKPSLKHDPISAQEGEVIEQLVQEMGKRWAEIARRLGNRSDNAVKNWWNGSVNRRRRNPSQTTAGFKQVGNRLQPIPFTLPSETTHTTYSRLQLDTSNDDNFADLRNHQGTKSHQHQPHQHLHRPCQTHLHTSPTSGTATTLPPSAFVSAQDRSSSLSTPSTESSRPSLPRMQTSELRPELPPLRSSSFHLVNGSRPNLAVERPPVSPALSDISQRQPPSLISDNQSSYSISPRTITTPRPGIPAPVEMGNVGWAGTHKNAQHASQFTTYGTRHPTRQYSKQTALTDLAESRPLTSSSNEERFKDVRMNVSALLQ